MEVLSTNFLSIKRGATRKWLSDKTSIQIRGFRRQIVNGKPEEHVILVGHVGRHECGDRLILPLSEINDPIVLGLLSNQTVIDLASRLIDSRRHLLNLPDLAVTKNLVPRELFILAMLHFSAVLTANIVTIKKVSLFGLAEFTGGTFLIPIVFLLEDVITQIYGFIESRRIVVLSLLMNIFVFCIIKSIVFCIDGLNTEVDTALRITFSSGFQILIASSVGYLAGSLLNVKLISIFRNYLKNSILAFRFFVATSVSVFLDTFAFVLVLRLFQWEGGILTALPFMFRTVFSRSIVKVVAAVFFTPIAALITSKLKLKRDIVEDIIDPVVITNLNKEQ